MRNHFEIVTYLVSDEESDGIDADTFVGISCHVKSSQSSMWVAVLGGKTGVFRGDGGNEADLLEEWSECWYISN